MDRGLSRTKAPWRQPVEGALSIAPRERSQRSAEPPRSSVGRTPKAPIACPTHVCASSSVTMPSVRATVGAVRPPAKSADGEVGEEPVLRVLVRALVLVGGHRGPDHEVLRQVRGERRCVVTPAGEDLLSVAADSLEARVEDHERAATGRVARGEHLGERHASLGQRLRRVGGVDGDEQRDR